MIGSTSAQLLKGLSGQASEASDPPTLSQKMQPVSLGEGARLPAPLQYNAPPRVAAFPETVQPISLGEERASQNTPPPSCCATFPEIVQCVSVGEDSYSQ